MRYGGVLVLIGLALGASGCTQTTSQLTAEPVATGPLVLNSAPGATPAPVAPVTTGTAPAGTVAATTPAAAPAPAPVQPAPVAKATPAPEPLPVAAPATAAVEPLPTTAPAAGTSKDGFPNLNVPPPEPGGTLLPAEERARIIAELEALRARQGAPGGGGGNGGGSDLANQAETHGQAAIQQIEECSEEGALQNNPDCAPAD